MNVTHAMLLQVLEARSYQALKIKRLGADCCFIIQIGDKDHVYVNESGEAPQYRHAWQVRKWLQERFGIPADAVTVEVFRHLDK